MLFDHAAGAKAFYDIDTPITVSQLRERGRTDYLLAEQVPGLDVYFSFTGGPMLQAGPPPDNPAAASGSPYRPRVIARFTGGDAGVLSGLMRGANQIRNRPMIVDAPSGAGHVLLFTTNPIYRWQTFGEHMLVFNALLFWNDLDGA